MEPYSKGEVALNRRNPSVELGLGNSGHKAEFRLQALADQVLDPGPEVRITFTLDVAGHESAVKPGGSFALHRSLIVVITIIAEDLCLGGVGRPNKGAAMDEAMRLVKIHGSGDVIGDDTVALPELGDAIDLHRKQHRNTDAIQFASKKNNS